MAYVDESGVTTLTNEIKSYIQTYFLDLHYPVGSIYLSVNSTSPATLFGGTWEQIQDRFLLSAGENYAAGSSGGEATITHTHQYGIQFGEYYGGLGGISQDSSGVLNYTDATNFSTAGWSDNLGSANFTYNGGVAGSTSTKSTYTRKSEGNTAYVTQTNMPPYLTVYMWKRVS